jgi:hypothetical protein
LQPVSNSFCSGELPSALALHFEADEGRSIIFAKIPFFEEDGWVTSGAGMTTSNIMSHALAATLLCRPSLTTRPPPELDPRWERRRWGQLLWLISSTSNSSSARMPCSYSAFCGARSRPARSARWSMTSVTGLASGEAVVVCGLIVRLAGASSGGRARFRDCKCLSLPRAPSSSSNMGGFGARVGWRIEA